ncbi:MAG: hypothetical protein M1834_002914 [Cirrosporium novae-zelandiae]|nr:MAG: hypothetical protein M1834_002914 [Cirrosporium novae-zelandiae]
MNRASIFPVILATGFGVGNALKEQKQQKFEAAHPGLVTEKAAPESSQRLQPTENEATIISRNQDIANTNINQPNALSENRQQPVSSRWQFWSWSGGAKADASVGVKAGSRIESGSAEGK